MVGVLKQTKGHPKSKFISCQENSPTYKAINDVFPMLDGKNISVLQVMITYDFAWKTMVYTYEYEEIE